MLHGAGFVPNLVLTPDAGHAGVKVSMLERGEAVAVAPATAASFYVELSGGRIAFVPLAEPAPRLPVDLLWDPRAVTPALEAFLDLVRDLGREGRLVPQTAAAL